MLRRFFLLQDWAPICGEEKASIELAGSTLALLGHVKQAGSGGTYAIDQEHMFLQIKAVILIQNADHF